MQALLAHEARALAEDGYPYRDRRLLEVAKENLEAKFPTKMGVRTRTRAPMTEMNGSQRTNGSTRRGWSDLRPEVAKMQDEFILKTPELKQMGIEKARAGILKNLKPQDFRR